MEGRVWPPGARAGDPVLSRVGCREGPGLVAGRADGLEGDGRRGLRMRIVTLLKIAGVAAVVRSSGGGRLCCAAAVWLHLV